MDMTGGTAEAGGPFGRARILGDCTRCVLVEFGRIADDETALQCDWFVVLSRNPVVCQVLVFV